MQFENGDVMIWADDWEVCTDLVELRGKSVNADGYIMVCLEQHVVPKLLFIIKIVFYCNIILGGT